MYHYGPLNTFRILLGLHSPLDSPHRDVKTPGSRTSHGLSHEHIREHQITAFVSFSKLKLAVGDQRFTCEPANPPAHWRPPTKKRAHKLLLRPSAKSLLLWVQGASKQPPPFNSTSFFVPPVHPCPRLCRINFSSNLMLFLPTLRRSGHLPCFSISTLA